MTMYPVGSNLSSFKVNNYSLSIGKGELWNWQTFSDQQREVHIFETISWYI